MTKSFLLLSIAALLLSACQPSERPTNNAADEIAAAAVDPAAEEQAIRAQIDHWGQLIKARDAASIAALYTEDGAVMPPGAPIGKGRAALQQTWESMMSAPGFSLMIMPEQIDLSSSGDMALDRGTYQLSVAPTGEAQIDIGKYVVVWRKVGDEWKAAADIFNSDGAPAAP